VGVYELLINFEKEHQLDLSRLFVYYNARLIEDAVQQDVGAYVRDVVKALKQYGVCAESVWPYNIDKFAAEPTPESYTDARSRTIKNYYRISGLPGALDALNNNWPVLFGMEVYPEFDDITTADPVLQMPNKDAEPIGGHAMCLVGYDLDKKLVIARNSFGPNWADHGYCYIPFDYVTNEFVDMWVFDIDLIKAN
jgi:C1A family cysteine protease